MRRIILFIAFTSLFYTSAGATPIDLSTFIAEPGDSSIVDIGTDTITFNENMDYGFIYAADDAFSVPDDATILSYDYSLTPGSADDYDWLVTVINNVNYEMEIEQEGSGTFSIDMTSYQGQDISLAFGLEYDWANDWDYGSVGVISNIDLATSAAPVPEPCTLLMVASGLVGFAALRKKRKKIE